MSDGRLREEQDRGAKAQALLKNPILVESFESLDSIYIEAWKSTSVEQDAQREKIFQMYQALQALRGHLEQVVTTGNLAKSELEENSKRRIKR
jgi:hypothetical protein